MSGALISTFIENRINGKVSKLCRHRHSKNLHYVALKFNDQGEQTVEHFEGFTEDLERMADWRTQN